MVSSVLPVDEVTRGGRTPVGTKSPWQGGRTKIVTRDGIRSIPINGQFRASERVVDESWKGLMV